MKRRNVLLVGGMLSLFPIVGMAQEWIPLDLGAEGETYFLDRTSIKIVDSKVRVWSYRNGDDGTSSRHYLEFDCEQEMVRMLSTQVFLQPDLKGSTREPGPPGEWRYLAPGTIIGLIGELVCGAAEK